MIEQGPVLSDEDITRRELSDLVAFLEAALVRLPEDHPLVRRYQEEAVLLGALLGEPEIRV